MKTRPLFIFVSLLLLFSSCESTDSESINPPATITLNKTVEFSPQSTGFNTKYVTNYVNNKRLNDTIYNNSGGFNERKEYTYTSNSTTILKFNSTNTLVNKAVYNYDSSNRITGIEFYNNQNVITSTRQYIYLGNDIIVNKTENGSTTLQVTYKTNTSNDLLYYEQYANGTVKTLNYTNGWPSQLDNNGFLMPYQFYPTPKPIQRTANEINSAVLSNLILDHMYFHCNYYLKKVTFPTAPVTDVNYTSEFNTNNYQTFMRTFSSDGTSEQNISEKFFYYN
jgi:hypothetical protein